MECILVERDNRRQSGSGAGERGELATVVSKRGHVVVPALVQVVYDAHLYTIAMDQNVLGIWATRISTWFLS